MDNKLPPNSPAFDIAKIAELAHSFISKAETGEGFNFTDEQKKEFKEKLKNSEAEKQINELKEKLTQLKNMGNQTQA